MFIHTVFFWMKPGTSDAARQQLVADAREYLGKIPTVRHLWAGRPAMTPRDVVDNSYDVGLCVVLDDSAGLDLYQEHPLHKEFLARPRPNPGAPAAKGVPRPQQAELEALAGLRLSVTGRLSVDSEHPRRPV